MGCHPINGYGFRRLSQRELSRGAHRSAPRSPCPSKLAENVYIRRCGGHRTLEQSMNCNFSLDSWRASNAAKNNYDRAIVAELSELRVKNPDLIAQIYKEEMFFN